MAKNALVSDKELKLPIVEKMQFIDQEIQILLDFCLKSGLNHQQIKENALPLLRCVDSTSRKKWLYSLLGFITFITVAVGLFYLDPIYRMAYMYGRYASIKILPIWDWTGLYYSNCLMDNPFYSANKIHKEDCKVCEDLMSIERVQNVSWQQMSDFLKNDVPIIVEDGLRNWENLGNDLTISNLFRLHLDNEIFKDFSPCVFTSNFRLKHSSYYSLLSRVLDDDLKKWYIHWENCEKPVAKVLRPYYKRPYFLPPMVESTESNWVFASSDYVARNFKEILFTSSILWFAQIHGENSIQISPKEPCSDVCPIFTENLKRGEIIVISNFLWRLDYLPIGGDENIAIAAGGFID